jgi:hypothetical protein
MTNPYPLHMSKLAKSVLFLSMLMVMNSELLAKEIAGKTIITKGVVQATDSIPGLQRILKRRSPIYGTDLVTTELDSKAQLRMTDGGMIALKENSELLIANYEFNAVDQTGSVVMELVKGGLRSVTGAIKSEKGNYQLKTPIGSIGIRGTHYEVEIIQGELFIAVWEGAVDISVDIGGAEQYVPLGDGEDYAYAKIDESGEVTEFLEPPENFNAGHSSDPKDEEETKETKKTEETETTKTAEKTDETKSTEATGEESDAAGQKTETSGEETDVVGQQTETASEETDVAGSQIQAEDEEILVFQVEQLSTPNQEQQVQEVVIVVEPIEEETDFITQDIAATELALTREEELSELIAARTGIFVYDQVSNLVFDTEAGSNFAASMSINFDTSEISNGSLSFDDADGVEWFAAFNGAFNGTGLDLGVNFASHGNELADGTIDSVFTEGVDELLNVFELFEVDNAEITTNGRFNLSH